MFTGIVETVGKVEENHKGLLRVRTELDGLKPGDSVSVNGACLTVVKRHGHRVGQSLEFEMSLETISRTALGLLREGDDVNLERPLTLQTFVGGHMVTGHVDAHVLLLSKKDAGQGCATLRVELPRGLRAFVPLKGSVAVDGVSLTVTKVGKFYFETVLVPHTLKHTTLGRKGEREIVNLEVDLFARYLNHILDNR